MPFHIWEGVYKSFRDVPVKGTAFNGKRWIQQSLKKIILLREDTRKGNSVPMVTQYHESLLPLVAAFVYNECGQVRILDVGGCIGFTYYQVLHGLPRTEGFEFHIVDTKPVCEAGREFFKDEQKIFFHLSLPNKTRLVFDIVHMGSSLQYIEKWEEMLLNLCRFQPRYFLFTDLPAGDIPTFATVQNYYDSTIPAWFFNIGEIIDTLAKLGYRLIFRSSYIANILGQKVDALPMDNFEKQYRVKHSCNLLFIRD